MQGAACRVTARAALGRGCGRRIFARFAGEAPCRLFRRRQHTRRRRKRFRRRRCDRRRRVRGRRFATRGSGGVIVDPAASALLWRPGPCEIEILGLVCGDARPPAGVPPPGALGPPARHAPDRGGRYGPPLSHWRQWARAGPQPGVTRDTHFESESRSSYRAIRAAVHLQN